MRKKFNFFIPVFFIVLVLVSACNTGPVKVGLLIHGLSLARWENDKKFLTDELEALGATVIVRQADDSQDIQNRQAQELIDFGVDVLIVSSADQEKSAEIISMAHKKDIEVIAYDRLIKNCDLDFYIATNSVRVGELQAEYMISIIPNGNYGLILGDKRDNNALLLFIGQMNELEDKIESGDIRVVYSEYTNSWTREEGYRCTKEMLEQNDNNIDAIILGSDALAPGAYQALEEVGLLGKVGIVSQDADLEILQEIVRGNQDATIYKPLAKMAEKTAEVAMKLAKNKKIEKNYSTVSNGKHLVPSYQLEPVLVNKENISSTVVADGFHTAEEIY